MVLEKILFFNLKNGQIYKNLTEYPTSYSFFISKDRLLSISKVMYQSRRVSQNGFVQN
jgi:hypothetical protein